MTDCKHQYATQTLCLKCGADTAALPGKKPSEWIIEKAKEHLKKFYDEMEKRQPGSSKKLPEELISITLVTTLNQAILDYLDSLQQKDTH
jgi:hypothetical protein